MLFLDEVVSDIAQGAAQGAVNGAATETVANIVNVCENSSVLKIISFIMQLLDIVFFIVPILLIVMLSIDLAKNVIAGSEDDMRKNLHLAIKRVIMAVGLFLVPHIVSFLMVLLGDLGVPYTDCINNSKDSDTIAAYEAREKAEIKEEKITQEETTTTRPNGIKNPSDPGFVPSKKTAKTGTGKGKVLDIDIQYNVKDKKGRCGKGSGDYCAAIATVKYEKETVKYYVGYQNNSQLKSGSCRAHAFMAVTNAIKGTTYSTLDLQKYMYEIGQNGILMAKGIDKAIKKYGLKATVYHSELTNNKAAELIKTALDNGQPVMIFVANKYCSDLAGTHHALLLLGYDEDDGHLIFVDSVPKTDTKKRTIKEMVKCLSPKKIANDYYRMIIFSFDS